VKQLEMTRSICNEIFRIMPLRVIGVRSVDFIRNYGQKNKKAVEHRALTLV
jgi:hypothetical protein